MFVFRNDTTFLKPSSSPYGTVVKYAATPYASGFVSTENKKKISNSAAVVVVPKSRDVLFFPPTILPFVPTGTVPRDSFKMQFYSVNT